ncbi:hypothetical protein Cfor_00861, partial [Coptotermes formosanus]
TVAGDLHDILELNINTALKSLNITEHDTCGILQSINCSFAANSGVRWRFVCVSLYILLSLKKCLSEKTSKCKGKEQPTADLLSVSQQKTIRTCLQFVISMGVLPSLLPGVGISLAARSTSSHKLKVEELVVLEKYERLAGVTRGLVACFEQPSLRSLILVQHLGDLVASLAQLSFAPLKKPASVTATDAPSSSPSSCSSGKQDISGEEFVMTPELWGRLQEERSYFKKCFLSLINKLYQPLIIRELILLHGSARSKSSPPTWLKRCCIPLLVQCLIKPGGVSALVRAICDTSCDIGSDWSKLDTVVEVILTVHVQHAEQYYKNICSQIVEMLNVSEKAQSQLYTTVSLLCMKALCSEKPLMFERYVLDILMNPVLLCCNVYRHGPTFYREVPLLAQKVAGDSMSDCVVSEDELSRSINSLHKCFVSDVSPLPSEHLFSVASVLFLLHMKIRRSACHLKTKVEELLLQFLSGCNQKQLHSIFNAFLFGDQVEGMLELSEKVEFHFGPAGGVEVKLRNEPGKDLCSETAGDCLLELLEKGDKKGDITNSLFVFLLRLLSDPKSDLALLESERSKLNSELLELEDAVILNIVGRSERNIVAVKLLAILAENPSVHEKLTEDPTHVIFFVQYLLERDANLLTKKDPEHNAEDHDTESLFMILMVLSVVVNNASTRHINWEPFKQLVEPLRVIRDNVTNDELKMFTDEVCNKILTHGSNISSKSQGKVELKESRCKQALFDVCDPLLPVRGHALLELAKLISGNDKEAQRHRNQILRIFQENLKHEDSYIYLSSINGLAVMANVFPNTVIKTLVEEYEAVRTKKTMTDNNNSSAELKMKVGEVLVRVTKLLGDLVPPYKAMLLNAFLVGTKDSDHFVRASSLSNLGEVCKALGFRIGPVVSEILMCVRSIVQSDPAVEVRRAAVLVISLLLQGLGHDTLKVLEDVLLDLYRTLKTLYQHEADDILKIHVQLALEELNKSVVKFLFPQPKLEKRLYVIDPPET